MTTVYFVGGEDGDFVLTGGAVGSGYSVITTAGHFRSGYARYALQNAVNGTNSGFIRSPNVSLPANFWFSAYTVGFTTTNARSGTRPTFIQFLDSSGIERIRIRAADNSAALPTNCLIEKVNSVGAATQIGGTFALFNASLLKIDININYAASGGITIYQAGALVISVSGTDMTTDGITSLASVGLGSGGVQAFSTQIPLEWSEVFLSGSDTRSFSAVTVPLAGNGATLQWTGTYTDINGNTYNDASVVTVGSANQVQQFTTGTAIPAGVFRPVGVYVSARAMYATGPTKLELGLKISGTDYWSSDITLTTAMAPYQYGWETNPATAAAWTAAAVASGTFGISMKSIT